MGANADSQEGESLEEATAEGLLLRHYELALGAPEEWRRRAATAGGLLSAGAAALLGGLLLSPRQDIPGAARWLSIAAGVCYIAAVALFLDAATRSPVRLEYVEGSGWVEVHGEDAPLMYDLPEDEMTSALIEEADHQRRPLERSVARGKNAALAAIVLTICAVAVLLWPQREQASIVVLNGDRLNAIQRVCPKFNEETVVTLDSTSVGSVAFTVPARKCLGNPVQWSLSSQDVAVVKRT